MTDLRLKQGMFLEVDIVDNGLGGEGIAKLNSYVVFVPFALDGERVKIRIDHVKKQFAYATLLEVLTPSPNRRKPICTRFYRCGGCSMLHIDYSKQLEIKKKALITTLYKNTHQQYEIEDIVPSDPEYPYRNKLSIPFGVTEGRVSLGFYRQGTHKVVSTLKCFLNGDWAELLIAIVLDYARRNNLSVYNEDTGKGLLRHLVARYLDGFLSVVLVVNGDKVKSIQELEEDIAKAFPDFALYLSVNKKKTNVIFGDKLVAIKDTVQYATLCGVSFPVHPMSFVQVNLPIASKIYNRIVDIVKPDNDMIFIDAYAGIGVLGTQMAKNGAKVYNIEIVNEATCNGQKLYRDNGLLADFICGDAAVELPKILKDIDQNKKVYIFLDPPRKGVGQEVIDAINSLKNIPDVNLIYLSCNPATLSRDIAKLDYKVAFITPYDMFPATEHLETVVLLSREKVDDYIKISVHTADLKKNLAGYATYPEIKEWVLENYGLKVSSLYIAQTKDKCGIKERENYNIGEGKSKELTCPPEKEKAIIEAFKHFGMIK